jgi:hypothetical protein
MMLYNFYSKKEGVAAYRIPYNFFVSTTYTGIKRHLLDRVEYLVVILAQLCTL